MQPTTPSPKSFPVATSAKRANLEVILLPLLPLRLTLANNPLTQPLRLKALIQLRQVLDDQPASRHDSFLGCDRPVGLDAQFKRGEERVGHFVGGEHDGGVLEEPLREEVAERVVFFVEGEDGRVGDACARVVSWWVEGGRECGWTGWCGVLRTCLGFLFDFLLAFV